MIRINQVKMPLNSTAAELERELLRILRIKKERLLGFEIVKRSVDARRADDIHYTYTLDAVISGESGYLKQNRNRNIAESTTVEYKPEEAAGFSRGNGPSVPKTRPVVCGSGPAGLFCAYFLAQAGCSPIVLERGQQVERRAETVEHFWRTGELDTETNVQFGEGGAGTFSDGKLNTAVKDTFGRIRAVLKTFVKFGAPEDILYNSKPHIGTDCLRQVVAEMREEAKRLGAEFCFETKLTGLTVEGGRLTGISCVHGGQERRIETDTLVLAIGHSARDTFEMLYRSGLRMEAKPFAVGVRVEHEQEFISRAQYKTAAALLPAADYKVTHTAKNGRGVYSFCMCPGGFVVNASSERERLAVNGMSNRARDGRNANSALIVTVTPEDFAVAWRKGPAAHGYPAAVPQEGSAAARTDFAAVFQEGAAAVRESAVQA
ncbi:MAG: FAD-binding protein, partial [Lachnospiraceae bacterium]|nr:FAD-binding protein [Lachnospiraceae bacterium]